MKEMYAHVDIVCDWVFYSTIDVALAETMPSVNTAMLYMSSQELFC